MAKEVGNRSCCIEKIEFLTKERRAEHQVPAGGRLTVGFELQVFEEMLFDPTFRLLLTKEDNEIPIYARHMSEDGWDISWLPRGRYRVEWRTEHLALPLGRYRVGIETAVAPNGHYRRLSETEAPSGFVVTGGEWADPSAITAVWSLVGQDVSIETFSWRKGRDNWFFKHFDHAARVIIHYMFDDSPLLSGKILDVGCGDGITALGVFLRKRPQLLVGLDLEYNFRELLRMMREHGLPFDSLPEQLIFRQVDVNHIPYPDDSFDVVISWASLEHITGGYLQALREIKRVLKDGGLFFAHPGLYYSSAGHHLGEFTNEPFAHLKKSPEELKQLVFTAQPRFMDRGGLSYSPADFWRYYSELNKMTVSKLEGELRALNFEFKKVAVRTEDCVAYTQELQKYSIQDLTTQEIYMALVNHKPSVSGKTDVSVGSFFITPSHGTFEYANYEFSLKDRQWNREILGPCVSFFHGCRQVLDLACGSGVFLELLAEGGIAALGVERNENVAAWVRAQGWEVVQQDVLEFLEKTTDTFDGIFCSHFLEHLPFDQILRLVELLIPRLEPMGTLVIVIPNPESIRMQLFGFWRDPEHVRFYHPELLETICRHYGLQIVYTNRQEDPFALSGLNQNPPLQQQATTMLTEKNSGWLRKNIRNYYGHALRALRLVPRSDLIALEEKIRQEQAAFQQAMTLWAEKTTWAVNRMWAWPDNAIIVCRKQGE